MIPNFTDGNKIHDYLYIEDTQLMSPFKPITKNLYVNQ